MKNTIHELVKSVFENENSINRSSLFILKEVKDNRCKWRLTCSKDETKINFSYNEKIKYIINY
jgi:hypothetical protein